MTSFLLSAQSLDRYRNYLRVLYRIVNKHEFESVAWFNCWYADAGSSEAHSIVPEDQRRKASVMSDKLGRSLIDGDIPVGIAGPLRTPYTAEQGVAGGVSTSHIVVEIRENREFLLERL